MVPRRILASALSESHTQLDALQQHLANVLRSRSEFQGGVPRSPIGHGDKATGGDATTSVETEGEKEEEKDFEGGLPDIYDEMPDATIASLVTDADAHPDASGPDSDSDDESDSSDDDADEGPELGESSLSVVGPEALERLDAAANHLDDEDLGEIGAADLEYDIRHHPALFYAADGYAAAGQPQVTTTTTT